MNTTNATTATNPTTAIFAAAYATTVQLEAARLQVSLAYEALGHAKTRDELESCSDQFDKVYRAENEVKKIKNNIQSIIALLTY